MKRYHLYMKTKPLQYRETEDGDYVSSIGPLSFRFDENWLTCENVYSDNKFHPCIRIMVNSAEHARSLAQQIFEDIMEYFVREGMEE